MARREKEPIATLILIAIALLGLLLNTAIPPETIFYLIVKIFIALAFIITIVVALKFFRYRAGKRILLKKHQRPA